MPLSRAIADAPSNLGPLIRGQRRSRRPRMSQRVLAEALGVDERTVRNWEHGATSPPLGVIPKIGSALSARFVDDGDGRWRAVPLEAVPNTDGQPPASAPAAQVVLVVVASPEDAADVLARMGLRQG